MLGHGWLSLRKDRRFHALILQVQAPPQVLLPQAPRPALSTMNGSLLKVGVAGGLGHPLGTWSMVRSHLIERGILYGSLMIHWGPGWRSLLGLWSRVIMTGFNGCTKG